MYINEKLHTLISFARLRAFSKLSTFFIHPVDTVGKLIFNARSHPRAGARVINSEMRKLPAIYVSVSFSELYIYGRLTSVNCVIKKCSTKWRKLKAFLGVIFSPLTCAVKYFCKFLFGFLWRKVFRNGFFPF